MPDSFAGFDVVEVRFKGGRKEFMRNDLRLPLVTGDAVVVDAAGSGWHLGHVSLKGELVRLQMRKKKVPLDSKEIRNILRVATDDDNQRWEAVRDLETGTMFRARAMVSELRLRMKLSDVEYQADRTRALFYYSAEDRVDFRELIRRLADEFRVRVEMRQISLRQEAGRIGGIGPAKQVADYAVQRGVTYVNHTFTSHLALSASMQPFAGLADHVICEYPAAPKALAVELTRNHLVPDANGQVCAPDAPGLGMHIDAQAVQRYQLAVEIRVAGRTLYTSPVFAP